MSVEICQEAQDAQKTYNRKLSLKEKQILAQKDEKSQVQYMVNPYFQWIMENYCIPATGTCGNVVSSDTTKKKSSDTNKTKDKKPQPDEKKPESDDEDVQMFDIFS